MPTISAGVVLTVYRVFLAHKGAQFYPQAVASREELGAAIRRLREAAGITSQRALARKAGLSPTYMSQLERGAQSAGPAPDTLIDIADALGATSEQILELFTLSEHSEFI